jgi:glycosyltransferase involved in cell wall biosynthesis
LAEPLVSILTPSFNQGRWLMDNLKSVGSQTYRNIEHIVMDGGSTDDSVDVLKCATSSVVWRSERDGGQADAINKAFARSQGEIIGWLNSDDAYFDCDVVESVVDFFFEHPEIDVVYGHAVRTNEHGKVIWVMWVPRFSYQRLRWFCYLVQPAVFIRRSALREPMLDQSFDFAMDWELWLRLGVTHRFGRIDRVLAIDRDQPNRKMRTALEVHRKDEQRLRGLYGAGMTPLGRVYARIYGVSRRLMGGLKVGEVSRARLAFSGYVEPGAALLKRQVLIPRSRWSKKDQDAGQ